jgi:hypothetical protein
LADGCFSGLAPVSLKVQQQPSTKQSWSSSVSHDFDAGASISLADVLPVIPAKWLPTVQSTLSKTTSIQYSVEFSNASITTVTNFPTALRDRVRETSDKNADAKRRDDTAACVKNFCSGHYTFSGRAFVAQITLTIKSVANSELKNLVGWSALKTDAHLNVTDKADGSREISSTGPVVLAVDSVAPSDMTKDLQNENVCPEAKDSANVKGALSDIGRAFVESYQCAVLYAGVELANSVCANQQAPSCGPDVPKIAPAGITSTASTCPPFALLQTYQCRVGDFDPSILTLACKAFQREVNVGRGAEPPISLACDKDSSAWLHDHSDEKLTDVLVEPALQANMAREFLRRISDDDLEAVLAGWGQRYGNSLHDQARSEYSAAQPNYNWITWPLGTGPQAWTSFEHAATQQLLDFISTPANTKLSALPSPRQYNPGCPGLVMAWDKAGTGRWRVLEPKSAQGMLSRGFGRPFGTKEISNAFAASVLPSVETHVAALTGPGAAGGSN